MEQKSVLYKFGIRFVNWLVFRYLATLGHKKSAKAMSNANGKLASEFSRSQSLRGGRARHKRTVFWQVKKPAKNISQNRDWTKMHYRIYVRDNRVLLLYSTVQVLHSWQESEFKGCHFFFSVAQLPYSGIGRLVVESLYYAQSDRHTRYDLCVQVISPSQRPLLQLTTNTRDEHPCLQSDSNPRSPDSSVRRPTPYKAWPPGSTRLFLHPLNYPSK